MAKFAHNSKAPSHCSSQEKYVLLHEPHPLPIFVILLYKKIPNIHNNTARAFSFFIPFFIKQNTNPHHEMQHKSKNIDKGITMYWESWRH